MERWTIRRKARRLRLPAEQRHDGVEPGQALATGHRSKIRAPRQRRPQALCTATAPWLLPAPELPLLPPLLPPLATRDPLLRGQRQLQQRWPATPCVAAAGLAAQCSSFCPT
jgi:hypothetical protein